MPSSPSPAGDRVLRVRPYLPGLISAVGMAALVYTLDAQFPLPPEPHFTVHVVTVHQARLLRPGALATTVISAAVVLLVARISRLHRIGTALITLLATLLSLAASTLAMG
ncbi:hypothetical protein ACN9MD_03910 [Stenotrophomonas maltophilia]|jgi:hypothetical protein|uniref:hypothetical protein n=1 Tax=Stenotrophomonas maltophilia TaxID=40324 RepID=UPI0018D420AB|nr:hypothetical protein [Stenotrophomonas maltophilia]